MYYVFGITATALSAIVGASIISEFESFEIVAGVLSLFLVVVSALSTFLNSEHRIALHHDAGIGFLVVSNKAEVLVSIDLLLEKRTADEIAAKIETLTSERDELIKNSPRIPQRYYGRETTRWEKEHPKLAATT